MAKKRRVRTSAPPPRPGAPAPTAGPPATLPTAPRRPASSLAHFDYTSVRRDLRRIGLLAALLLGAQVALAFLLPHLLR
ncbi:MAG: hypothetical protein C4313_04895 [Thermoflexus sp.]|uniref:hypothetical protein n=1 Tax=Thermoflexus sp. TaxID=1969742 RepID=UPI0033230C98